MEQHLPFSHSVLTRNILYYKNTPQQKHYTHPHRRWYNQIAFLDRTPIEIRQSTIHIKVLVCDSECPYDILLGRTSLAHLLAWQDYANNKLYIQQNFHSYSNQKQCQNFTRKYQNYFGSIENRQNHLYTEEYHHG